MCLRFVYLLITRASSWLRLSRHEETWKTAKILILRLSRAKTHSQPLTWHFALVTLLCDIRSSACGARKYDSGVTCFSVAAQVGKAAT